MGGMGARSRYNNWFGIAENNSLCSIPYCMHSFQQGRRFIHLTQEQKQGRKIVNSGHLSDFCIPCISPCTARSGPLPKEESRSPRGDRDSLPRRVGMLDRPSMGLFTPAGIRNSDCFGNIRNAPFEASLFFHQGDAGCADTSHIRLFRQIRPLPVDPIARIQVVTEIP